MWNNSSRNVSDTSDNRTAVQTVDSAVKGHISVTSSSSLIALTVLPLALSFALLFLLLKEKKLRTPFNVYIIALLCGNSLYVGIGNPMSILTDYYGYWWMGFQACTVKIYTTFIISAITVHIHVLISMNRAWALFWPVSYKNRHTSRVAALLCLAAVVYLHILLMPAVVIDALYYRKPSSKSCYLDTKAQFTWTMIMSVWVFEVPKLIIPVSYPLLLWKSLQRRRWNRAVQVAAPDGAPNSRSTGNSGPANRKRESKSQPFIVLTLFTLSASVCWTPSMVYYRLAAFVPLSTIETLHEVHEVLSLLLPLLDPLFFALSIASLRRTVVRLAKCRLSQ